eukprot:SAG22_NODE_590_length_8826_cov_6.627134_8_plen_368_part_00
MFLCLSLRFHCAHIGPLQSAEHQTTGGYKVPAVVVQADLWQVGQMLPGDRLEFVPTTVAEAAEALAARRQGSASTVEQKLDLSGTWVGPPTATVRLLHVHVLHACPWILPERSSNACLKLCVFTATFLATSNYCCCTTCSFFLSFSLQDWLLEDSAEQPVLVEQQLDPRSSTLESDPLRLPTADALRNSFTLVPRHGETTGMRRIDLNADCGEGFDDAGLLEHVTSVNIACGGHVGTPNSIAATVALAAAKGVGIGAHPSFDDKEGWGRVRLDTDPRELRDQLLFQVGALDGLCRGHGARVQYIKPHGALYHAVMEGGPQGLAVFEAAQLLQLPLLLMPRSPWATFGEGFAERAYDGDALRPRDKPG